MEMPRSAVSVLSFIGQILSGVPFVVFAYWNQRQEALYRRDGSPWDHTMLGHGIAGLFFSISFAFLAMMFFPPVLQTITLIACAYLFIRALDNIEYEKVRVYTPKT